MESLESRRLLTAIVYVDAVAPGPAHNGSSWTDAYTSLQTALGVATSGTTIEVAQGTYKPTSGSDRTATFQLIDGVTLEGGFAGYGTVNPDARDAGAFPTILSGDIGTIGDNADNNYHVVTGSGTDSTAVLDGFTVTLGNANGGAGSGMGGGIYDDGGSPTIADCTFTSNSADLGGAVGDDSSSPTLTDCAFVGNTATAGGGGLYDASSPGGAILTNCTFSSNSSPLGDAIDVGGTSVAVTNSILWDASGGNEIYDVQSTASVAYSDVEGGYDGTGNIDADPMFVRNPDLAHGDYGDLSLQGSSPCIDAGKPGGAADMGAYETFSPLVFVVQPADAVAGVDQGTITVNVEDQSGNVVTTDNSMVTLSIFSGPNNGVLLGTAQVAAQDGVANFTGLTLDIAGVYTLQASDGTDPAGVSDPFTIVHAAPAQVALVTLPSAGDLGAPLSVVGDIQDQYGNFVNDDDSSVTLSLDAGPIGAILGGTTTVNAFNGVATFNDVFVSAAGAYKLNAASNEFVAVTASSQFAIAYPSVQLVFHHQPARSIAAGRAFSSTVLVEDGSGHVVRSNPDLQILVTIKPVNGAERSVPLASEFSVVNGSLTTSQYNTVGIPLSALPPVNGSAGFGDLVFTTAGVYTLTASLVDLSSSNIQYVSQVQSVNITIKPAAAAQVIFTQQPGDVAAGNAENQVSVQVEDRYGNILTGDNSHVSLSLTGAPPGAAIKGTTTVAALHGMASFDDFYFTKAGTYFVVASGSLAHGQSSALTVSPGAIAKLVFAGQPSGFNAGAQSAKPIVVDVEDQYGNLAATSDSVTLSLAVFPAGDDLGGTETVLASGGVATFSDVFFTMAGRTQLNADLTSSPGNPTPVKSNKFTVQPA